MSPAGSSAGGRVGWWRLGLLLFIMVGLFLFDMFVPPVVVLPFVCVPVVVAAAWYPPRVVAGLAVLDVLMTAVSGIANDYFTSLNGILWTSATVLVGGVAVVAAWTRMRLESREHEMSARLEATLDAQFDPHVMLEAVRDRTGRIVDFVYTEANPAACEYNKVSREDLVGARLLDVLPGHLATGLLDTYRHVVETGEPLVLNDFAYEQELRGGELRRYDIRGVKVGESISYTWRDVTDRFETARAVEVSEERYRLLAENASDVVAFATNDGVVQWVSPSVTALLGWSPEDFVGHRSMEFLHPEDRGAVLAAQADLAQGEPRDFEARVRTATGRYRWVASHVSPVRGPDGSLIGRVAGWRDIEDEHAGRVALAESEHRFRTLAENASDIVYEAGPDHLIRWIAPTVHRTLGWRPEELVGTTFNDLIHPDDLPVTSPIRERLYAGSEDAAREPTLMRLRARDGTYSWFAGRARPVFDADGAPAGLVAGLQSVDEVVSAVARAEDSKARLQATLDSLLDPHMLLHGVRDQTGRIVDFEFAEANPAACVEMTGASGSLMGASLVEIAPAYATTGVFDMYARVVESGEPLVLDDYQFPPEIRPDDHYYDVRGVRVDDGLSITWRDVTDRHDAVRQIAESEELYRLLAENSSDVVMRSRDQRIIWVSPSLTDALGWQPADWVGHRFGEFVNPDDIPATDRAREEMQAGQPSVVRIRFADAAGDWHWVEVHSQVYRDAEGNPDGYLSSFRVVDKEVEAEGQLERRATYDDLTGALKRDPGLRQLHDIGQHPRTPGQETGVLFVDVDDFKHVNDTYGHAAGDALLRRIASVIHECVRGGDSVARMGSDEFLVILTGLHGLDEAAAIAEKIRAGCAQPMVLREGTVTATISVGVTLSDPIETGDDLVARADRAMYAAKAAGRNQVVTVPREVASPE